MQTNIIFINIFIGVGVAVSSLELSTLTSCKIICTVPSAGRQNWKIMTRSLCVGDLFLQEDMLGYKNRVGYFYELFEYRQNTLEHMGDINMLPQIVNQSFNQLYQLPSMFFLFLEKRKSIP